MGEVGRAAGGGGEVGPQILHRVDVDEHGALHEMRKKVLEQAGSPRFKPYVDALTRLKGVDDVTALAYCATMDDFSRFGRGRSVSRYFGLVPSRSDSGEKTGHNGPITKAGDATVRRAVIEGIASLPRFNGAPKWERKGHEVSAAVEAEAVKCNQRNRGRYRDMVGAGKNPQRREGGGRQRDGAPDVGSRHDREGRARGGLAAARTDHRGPIAPVRERRGSSR